MHRYKVIYTRNICRTILVNAVDNEAAIDKAMDIDVSEWECHDGVEDEYYDAEYYDEGE